MKKIFSDFATYTQNKVVMNPQAKEKIKQNVGNYYNALYGEDSVSTKVRGFVGGFFQPPVTFAKLAVYIIGTTTLTTGVYAGVAPESFSQTSNAVSTTVQKAVSTSLEVLNIRPKVSDDTIADDNRGNRGKSSDDNTTSDEIFENTSSDDVNHDVFDDKGGDRNDSNRFDNSRDDSDDDRFDDKGGNREIINATTVRTSNSGKGSIKDKENDEVRKGQNSKGKSNPIITVRTGTANTGNVSPIIPKQDNRDDRDDFEDDDRYEDKSEDFKEDHEDDRESKGRDSNEDREEHDD